MTDALTTAIETVTEQVAAISDPIERYETARRVREELGHGDRQLMLIQQEVASGLKSDRTWAEVGDLLGVTGSRAEQIARER